jgi:small-conductance mechanosensitive channel
VAGPVRAIGVMRARKHLWWWIESCVDTRRVLDRVHTALQHALDEAGIESPFPTQSANLVMGQSAADSLPPCSEITGTRGV